MVASQDAAVAIADIVAYVSKHARPIDPRAQQLHCSFETLVAHAVVYGNQNVRAHLAGEH